MKKILIVDDITGWRNHHANILSELIVDSEIFFAESAKDGYDKLLEHNDLPFDIIITDLQMETDFEPKYAGEWFVEQIQTFKNYKKTQVVIISAAYNIEHIANSHGINFIRKGTAKCFPDAYDFLKQ